MNRSALVALPMLGSALFGCGSYPCQWDTLGEDRSETPGITLVCESETYPVIAQYRNSVSPSFGPESFLSVRFITVGHSIDVTIDFPATLPDGAYEAGGRDGLSVNPSSTGTFAFSRSRDVPLADIEDPKERVYESSIEVDVDLEPVGSGCRLATETTLTLVQAGPVRMCSRSSFGGGH